MFSIKFFSFIKEYLLIIDASPKEFYFRDNAWVHLDVIESVDKAN